VVVVVVTVVDRLRRGHTSIRPSIRPSQLPHIGVCRMIVNIKYMYSNLHRRINSTVPYCIYVVILV